MKKFSKILVAVLALCLLVGIATLAISANSGTDGKFVVDGVGYDSWDDAVTAAAGGKTIYLNEDVTVTAHASAKAVTYYTKTLDSTLAINDTKEDEEINYAVGYNITEDVILDLGGHKLTQSFDGILFNIAEGVKLNVKGEGSFENVRTLVRTSGGELLFDARGNGIEIKNIADSSSQKGRFVLFLLTEGAIAEFSGYTHILPADEGTMIFRATGSKEITFDAAEIMVEPPQKPVANSKNTVNEFIKFLSGTTVNIYNSSLYIDHGRMFNVPGGGKSFYTDLNGFLGAWPVPVEGAAKPSLKQDETYLCYINAKNSSIEATSFYMKPAHDYMGQILCVDEYPLIANFDNCYFQGGGRTFQAGTNATPANYQASPHQLTFTNCTFQEIWNNCSRRQFFVYGSNVDWTGGRILGYGAITYEGSTVWQGIISQNAYPYAEVANGFIGTRFRDVAVLGVSVNPTKIDLSATPSGHSWKSYYTAEDVKTGQQILDGDKLLTYTTIGNPTLYSDTGIETRPDSGKNGNGVGSSSSGLKLVSEIGANGNEYKRLDCILAGGGSSYAYITMGGDLNSSGKGIPIKIGDDELAANAKVMNFTDYDYIIQEFDLSTATKFPTGTLNLNLELRPFNSSVTYNDDGSVASFAKGWGNYGSKFHFQIKEGGTKFSANGKAEQAIDIQPGKWVRISTVYEMNCKKLVREVDTVGGGKANATFCDFSESKIHVFIDGELLYSGPFLSGSDALMHEDLAKMSYLLERRITSAGQVEVGDSVLIDNTFVGGYNGECENLEYLINNHYTRHKIDYVYQAKTGERAEGFASSSAGSKLSSVSSGGNSYRKLEYTAETGGNYTHFQFGNDMPSGANSATSTAGVMNFTDYDYIVQEFDISTDGTFPSALGMALELRGYTTSAYNDDGTPKSFNKGYSGASGFSLSFSENGKKLSVGGQNAVEVDIQPGKWVRISTVYEMKYNVIVKEVDTASGKVNATFYDFSPSRAYVYVNGVCVYNEQFIKSSYQLLHEDLAKMCYLLERRISHPSGVKIGDTALFDNTFVGGFNGDYKPEELINNMTTEYLSDTASLTESLNLHKIFAGKVDGVAYKTEEELIAAIKPGSLLELNRDLTKPLTLDGTPFAIKTYGHSYTYVSDTTRLVNDDNLRLDRVHAAYADEVYNTVYKAEAFGIDKTVPAVLGSLIVIPDDVGFEGTIPSEGYLTSYLTWQKPGSPDDLIIKLGDANADGDILLEMVCASERYYYTTEVDGEDTVYYKEADKDAFAEKLNALISENAEKAISVVLWSEQSLTGSGMDAAIALSTKAPLYFDLNGNILNVRGIGFGGSSGAELHIFSTCEGALIQGADSCLAMGIYHDGENGMKISVGAFADVNLGVDAAGKNISLTLPCVAMLYTESGAPYANKLTLTLDGAICKPDAEGSECPAFILLSADADVTIDGIEYESDLPLITAVNGTVSANITNSFILAKSEDLDAVSFVDELTAGSSVSVSDTYLKTGASVTGDGVLNIGENVQFFDESKVIGAPGVSLPEELAAGYAKYTLESPSGKKLEVNLVTDKKENLAFVKWYDSDRVTVIGETYHAALGEIVDEKNFYKQVNYTFGTDWYDVGFTSWDFPAIEGAGEYDVYPICDEPYANVKALKMNLTAYTYFRLNYYLPVVSNTEEGFETFRLIGIAKDETGADVLPFKTVKLDGKEYLMYNEYPGAADASVNKRYILFEIDGRVLTFEFEFGVPTYAQTVMENENSSESDKKLIMNMARYANESYKLVNGGVGNEIYEGLIQEHSELLYDYNAIKASAQFQNALSETNTSKLSRNMVGASFIFGSYQPRFVFLYNSSEGVKAPAVANGDIGEWPENNMGVFTHIYYENFLGDSRGHLAYHIGFTSGGENATASALENGAWAADDEVYAMTNDVFVCDIIQPIKLAVYAENGTVVRGTYSLAAYISNLEANGNTEFHDASMALYAFSLAAQEYGEYLMVGSK